MTGPRERELKLEIQRREDYLELRDGAAWGTRAAPERQINHYFDTPDDALLKSRTLLRIREESSKCLLTLKCGAEVRPGFFDSLELESEVSPAALAEALDRPEAMLDWPHEALLELKRRFGRPRLRVSGRLENERVRREVAGERLDVDCLRFPDGSEAYELEIETQDLDRTQTWLTAALRSKGIHLEPQRQTKMERYRRWRQAHEDSPLSSVRKLGGPDDPGRR